MKSMCTVEVHVRYPWCCYTPITCAIYRKQPDNIGDLSLHPDVFWPGSHSRLEGIVTHNFNKMTHLVQTFSNALYRMKDFIFWFKFCLTHWGRVTHICVGKLSIIGSDNGLPPGRHQAIIWTNAVLLSIGPLGTNVSQIILKIQTFSFKNLHLKMSSGKWRPFCLGFNVLSYQHVSTGSVMAGA